MANSEERNEEGIKEDVREDTSTEGVKIEFIIPKEEDKRLRYLTEYLYKGGFINENDRAYTTRYAILYLYEAIKNYIKERRKKNEK